MKGFIGLLLFILPLIFLLMVFSVEPEVMNYVTAPVRSN